MNNSAIHRAIDVYLDGKVAGQYEIFWRNISGTPPVMDEEKPLYLEVDFLPAQNDDISLQGEAKICRGIYQVTVIGMTGTGTQDAESLADTIAAWFPNNLMILTEEKPVCVNGHASVFTGIIDDTGYRVPVSIPYIAMA